MKKNVETLGIILIMSLGIIVYLLIESRKKENQIIEGNAKYDNLQEALDNVKKEVNELIESKDELNSDLKNSLSNLVNHFKGIDKDVSDELISISSLVDIKEESKAILSLVKIIENLLKKIYLNKFKNGKDLKLYKLIEFAKNDGLLEKEEYHFLNGLRELRNQEAHEVKVKKDKNILISSLLTGIAIIFKLS